MLPITRLQIRIRLLAMQMRRIFFEIELEQDEKWQTCADLILEHGQHIQKPSPGSCSFGQEGTSSSGATPSPQQSRKSNFDERQARWQARCTNIATPNDDLYRTYRQAVDDMGALRNLLHGCIGRGMGS